MQTVAGVIDSLYYGIIRICSRLVCGYVCPDEEVEEKPAPAIKLTEEEIEETELIAKEEIPEETVSAPVTKKKQTISLARGMVMYAGEKEVPVYQDPTIAFDSQISVIPFGAMVIAGNPTGRFFEVAWNDITGWVLRDDLSERATDIYPHFIEGEENQVDCTNTARTRALIDDEFGLGRSEYPLQAGEYVLYRLWKKGQSVVWPKDVCPRTPGTWHEILKGVHGAHIALQPTASSIMEYYIEEGIGHVAYVEAVFPDDTISISEVNNPSDGIYNERSLRKEEWREFHPIFITIES